MFCACASFTSLAIYQRIRHKRVSLLVALVALITLLPVSLMLLAGAIEGDLEYNPWISSSQKLVGIYQANDQAITLLADGTYTSTGFAEIKSGTWSNYDWNLHLSDSRLAEPRIITRNGVLCIAPFYRGVDYSPGILLIKQSD